LRRHGWRSVEAVISAFIFLRGDVGIENGVDRKPTRRESRRPREKQ